MSLLRRAVFALLRKRFLIGFPRMILGDSAHPPRERPALLYVAAGRTEAITASDRKDAVAFSDRGFGWILFPLMFSFVFLGMVGIVIDSHRILPLPIGPIEVSLGMAGTLYCLWTLYRLLGVWQRVEVAADHVLFESRAWPWKRVTRTPIEQCAIVIMRVTGTGTSQPNVDWHLAVVVEKECALVLAYFPSLSAAREAVGGHRQLKRLERVELTTSIRIRPGFLLF